MKFRITMKDPDGVFESIEDAVKADLPDRHYEYEQMIKPWFRFSEYITVEIDTEAKTCVVVPPKD